MNNLNIEKKGLLNISLSALSLINFVITPSTHILQYNGDKNLSQVPETDEQILEIEPVKILRGIIQLEGDAENLYEEPITMPDATKSNYYGTGVEDAWAMGCTGKDVVLGLVGVGIDTQLLDLKENIKKDWSFNFVQNNTNVAPEHFQDHPETLRDTNHGNNVASIIAAVKDNNFCSAGIAYHSQIVVLKVFEFNYTDNSKLSRNHWTASDASSRALSINYMILKY
ncbi:endoprotease bli-like [Ruditapes philippinarum]|uniref:endoprotease bli-like n=1 Tax=Ruditapes philippinarum TaxID=129788 RepID=UPI00295BEF21|nr:endoprotease bli-like [Ruditapes philippinarum]